MDGTRRSGRVRLGGRGPAAWMPALKNCRRRVRQGGPYGAPLIIDVHVHVSALTPGHGSMSRRILDSAAFRFIRWRLGVKGENEATERALERKLVQTIEENT